MIARQLLVRFALWWTGQPLAQLQLTELFWYFMKRSRAKAYCMTVFGWCWGRKHVTWK